jgi:N4-gp56 family major capsid protein
MPIGAGHQTVTTSATFIPEVWADEVVATYKANLVAKPLIKMMNFKGKKGDSIHIPRPGRGAAAQKLANTQVTLNTDTATEVIVNINQHWEYSRVIEDIVGIQALSTMRRFYTEDAGYALARKVDSFILEQGRKANGGNGTNAYNAAYSGADGTTLYTGTAGALTDAAIRRTIQRLDDQDVPMDGRFLIVPPSTRNTLMGLARFTEQSFTGENGPANTIRNGKIGDVYGIPVFVTTNADSAADGDRVALMAHRDFAVFVEQLGVRTQTQYKQEFLADLFTADTLFGAEELRDYSAVALMVPA